MAGNDANTLLLLHCDGADTSTTIPDSSVGGTHGNADIVGSAELDTAQKEFGTASLLCQGTDDYITYDDDADWEFAQAAFTIDFRVRFNGTSEEGLISFGEIGQSPGWSFWLNGNDLRFDVNGSTKVFDYTWNPNADTWYHVAIVRIASDSWILFIDGVEAATSSNTITMNAATALLRVGDAHGISGGKWIAKNSLDGWMDEVRISNIARWTTDFTPPTEAYSADTPAGGGRRIFSIT